MQALESLRAAVSGARAAVTGAAGSALHSLPIIGHLTAHDDTRHGVPHFPETGYVGGNAICAAAGKRMEDYLSKRTTKTYLRTLVKDGTVSSEDDLIHQHGAEGPFLHPKLALHLAQWCNPAFASVVNGWVLRYIAADRTLADDILRRAEGGGGVATLGSSLTHTMQEVPMLPDSQPQGEAAGGEEEAPLPLPDATVASAAAAEAPAAKAPAKALQRKADVPMAEVESEPSESEPSEEEAGPTPVKTPKTRQPRRARVGAKATPRAKAPHGRVAKAKAGGRRRRGAAQETYKIHLHRVLKQIHPDMSISAKGMEVLNNMVQDMFEALATEASMLLRKDKSRTLTARELAAAVKLRFTGDLRAHAMSEGAKAVARFSSKH